MTIARRIPFVLTCLLAVFAGREGSAVEGKWTPQQLRELDPKWLRELGLTLPVEKLWGPDGGGLLASVPSLDGCSSGFVSAEGLVITNHHCAYGILQLHSTPEKDLIKNGFLARTRAEELSGRGERATLPVRITDVTAEIQAAVPAGADDLARFQAIERKTKELVAACEKQPNRRCQVATYDGGVQYLLHEGAEYPDVRLVYAPPDSVGEYGGETDNYAWPRHTGDFAILRIYAGADNNPAPRSDGGAGNVPYRPQHFFPISTKGIEPGDFVLVAGYPGFTFRSYVDAEARERAELFYPRQAALYKDWIGLMQAASAEDTAGHIAVAARIKSAANNEKRALGRAEAIRRGGLLARKRQDEQKVLAWADSRPEHQAAAEAYRELTRLTEERLKTWDRDFLLGEAKNGAKPLEVALSLTRWATERAKPDLERDPAYMDRNRDKAAESLRNAQKQMYPPAEEALLADTLTRFAALPEGSRVPAVERLLGGERAPAAIRARAHEVLSRTRVTDAEERAKMFGESAEQLRARRDPLLDLAFGLQEELIALQERNERHQGAVSRLRPVWRRAVRAQAGRPIDPDGNATLRVSFAHVKGYSPRDAVWMEPRTTVAGMAAKSTGEAPFDAPDDLLAAAPAAPKSRWAAPKLGDVPVNFLTDGDTAGGSSGSPVLNGRGELVGVNFDRVWENVGSDFGYDPKIARNVNADVRYLLWLLETEHGAAAAPLLRELGIEPAR
jgi:hypothetical protein